MLLQVTTLGPRLGKEGGGVEGLRKETTRARIAAPGNDTIPRLRGRWAGGGVEEEGTRKETTRIVAPDKNLGVDLRRRGGREE